MAFKFQYEKQKPFELLPKGEYPFEVVAADKCIQGGGGATSGSDKFDIKVALFKNMDAVAKGEHVKGPTKRVEIREGLISHPNCYSWVSSFFEAANFFAQQPKEGQGFEPQDTDLIGLRGWCRIDHEPDKNDATKVYLRVKAWLTGRPEIPKAGPPQPQDEWDK